MAQGRSERGGHRAGGGRRGRPWVAAGLLGAALLATGCATVPKETVELSYVMGEDLAALRDAYQTLIAQHFQTLRARRLAYLEDAWAPRFLEAWVEDGRLVDVARGKVVWSHESGGFVPPPAGREGVELLATVQTWAKEAVRKIDEKRSALLAPLDAQERQLRGVVDAGFDRLLRANAQVTAHLNSLREVEAVQDRLLEALDVRDLRDRLNDALVRTSEAAEKGLDAIRRADGFLDAPAAGDAASPTR